jgi:predicted DNA binding CopG/RHH family protein
VKTKADARLVVRLTKPDFETLEKQADAEAAPVSTVARRILHEWVVARGKK